MVKIRILTLFLLLSLCLLSCGKVKETRIGLFSSAFTCEYSYKEGDTTIRARLTSYKKADGRVMTLTFLEPSTLLGLYAVSEDGAVRAVCGDTEVVGEAAEALMSSSALFFDPSVTEFCGRRETGGAVLEEFKLTSEDGQVVRLFIDGGTELPVRLSAEGRELDIISFERLGG